MSGTNIYPTFNLRFNRKQLVFTLTFIGVAMVGKHAGTAFEMVGRLNPFFILKREKS